MTFQLTRSGDTNRVLFELENANVLVEKGIRKAWFAVGQDVKRTANAEILRKPKSGRTYVRRDKAGRRRRHIASAPGETHANQSGRLRKSIGWKVNGAQMRFGYGVTREAPEYADWVEFGTKKMEARPSLQNAIKETNRNTEQELVNAVAEAFNQ